MSETADIILNVDAAPLRDHRTGDRWGATYRIMTPAMRPSGGSLGVNWICVPPGRAAVPFHAHMREDEAFYVLSGRGVLRYGDELREVGPGDCISCPARTGKAHQLANPFAEELVYLAIGRHDPDEVCTYPDTGKLMVRSLQTVGRLEGTPYMDGEPDVPRIFDLIDEAPAGDSSGKSGDERSPD